MTNHEQDLYNQALKDIKPRAIERINTLENISNKLKGTKYEHLIVFFTIAKENIKYIVYGECDITEETQDRLIRKFIEGLDNG